SGTITDASGRTLSGQTAEAFHASIAHARPLSVGLNCALGARDLRPHVETLARVADCHVSTHPNAGLPNAFGGYDETPEETAAVLREFAEAGLLNLVGGCCGTTPDHIRAIAGAVAGLPPRRLPSAPAVAARTPHARTSRRPAPPRLSAGHACPGPARHRAPAPTDEPDGLHSRTPPYPPVRPRAAGHHPRPAVRQHR